MPDYEQILVETDRRVTTITFNRPEALNAITPTMLAEVGLALDAAASDADTGVVVLTGAGRAFSAGVDLKALGEIKLEAGAVGGILDVPARAVIERIETMSKPVIAKVNGFCFTGALEIALGCDLFYVAREAKLGDTHTKWGLRPSWGMSQRLPRAIGLRKARELTFTARTFTGEEAEALGLANRAVPGAELDATVRAIADAMLANSAEAIAACKALYRKAATTNLLEGLAYEESTQFVINDTVTRLAEFAKKS